MANEQNLKPVRNEKEARELGRKGGIASGEARRQKATMRETLRMMLEDIPKDDDNKLGLTNKQLATLGLIVGARQGNATNYKTILETIGELTAEGTTATPTLKIEVIDNSKLESKMYEENKHNENDNG
jgi:hypothetical protein